MSPTQYFGSFAAATWPWFAHSTTVDRLSPLATSRPQVIGVSLSSGPRYSSAGMSLTTGSVTLRSSAVGYDRQVSSTCSLASTGNATSCG